MLQFGIGYAEIVKSESENKKLLHQDKYTKFFSKFC